MNQPQVSIFPAEMTTALYRRAIASAWRQKMLNETGSDQYGPHSLTVERIEMAIALHIECVLINEYGEVQGIVTPRDVLEAIAGQFKPENTGDPWAIRRSDGSWLLDGIISTPDLKDRLGIREVPEEDEDRYSTLSGMVMLLLGRVPREGDSVDWADWKFEVVDMDGRRIDKVLAIPLSGAKKTEEPEGSSAS